MADEIPQALALQLEDDLRSLGPRLEDERFVHDLYDALARTRWTRHDRPGAVSLSFGRAEQLLNGLQETLAEGHREADEHPPVPKQGTPGR